MRLYRGWLSPERADALLASIRASTSWVQERRKMYDRFVDVPREQAWFGDHPTSQSDAGNPTVEKSFGFASAPPAREARWGPLHPFTPELDAVRRDLEALTGERFSHVLLNRYRTGNDSVAWHHDREVDHLKRPVIGSLTLGATRPFDLRPKAARHEVISIDLDHGDLLVMRGDTQTNWEHRVAKHPRLAGERINLTFRQQPA